VRYCYFLYLVWGGGDGVVFVWEIGGLDGGRGGMCKKIPFYLVEDVLIVSISAAP